MDIQRLGRRLGKQIRSLAFARVRDSRRRRGRRWIKQALLNATVLGLVSLQNTLRGWERLTEHLPGGGALGIKRRVPDSTLARFWSGHRDEAGLRDTLVRQVRALERRKALVATRAPIDMVAIDGKTIWSDEHPVPDPACQAQHQDGRTYYRIHTLHAVLVSAASQPVLGQQLVKADTNEMGTFTRFLTWLLRTYGRSGWMRELVSLDAGMVSAAHARQLAAAGVGYLFAVKQTQPTLFAEAQRLCGSASGHAAPCEPEVTTPWEHYQGRKVQRALYRSDAIAGWDGWESVRQVWRVRQTTQHRDGRREVEDRYFVTNLPWGRLRGTQILTVVRLHWGIENGCHWMLDVVMKQDERPLCAQGKAVRMLSWMRLLAYNLLRSLRDRTLRSESNRTLPWVEVGEWLRIAIKTGGLRDEAPAVLTEPGG